MNPAIIAAAVSALGSLGSSAISRKQDSPASKDSLLDWAFPNKHGGRPGFTRGTGHYQYTTSHFAKPPPGIAESDKVYDDNGRLLGWFRDTSRDTKGKVDTGSTQADSSVGQDFVSTDGGTVEGSGSGTGGFFSNGPDNPWVNEAPANGPANYGSGSQEWNAKAYAKSHPYLMTRGTEGEMFLGQRENVFRQDLDFSAREAANSLSIRRENLPETMRLDRQQALYNYDTSNRVRVQNQSDTQDLAIQQWNWQRNHAQVEGDAFRARMQAQYPGASTWDLLSGGTASGAGPGAVPGLPGMPTPSPGGRSGPDASAFAAKLAANSQMMQTMVNAKLQQQQMAMQSNIAKRTALIQFMNTAIAGAKTPSEIAQRSEAAKVSASTVFTDQYRRGLLHNQANEAAAATERNKASTALINAQKAKTIIEGRNAKYGRQFEQWRNIAKEPGLKDMLGSILGDKAGMLYELFRSSSIR